jgi:hypothetical protein
MKKKKTGKQFPNAVLRLSYEEKTLIDSPLFASKCPFLYLKSFGSEEFAVQYSKRIIELFDMVLCPQIRVVLVNEIDPVPAVSSK